MKCPVCNVDLLMGERLTISIDYCPQCRGIWLEKGKLDQVISSVGNDQNAKKVSGSGGTTDSMYGKVSDAGHDDHHSHHDNHGLYPKKHKRKSFFEELFD